MLPIMTSPDDVSVVIEYLQTTATGASMNDAKATLEPKVLDPRKMAAYEFWGLIEREGDRLRLTPEGRRFARANAEQRQQQFGEVIRRIRAYRLAAEWMFHQRFSTVPLVELAAHWVDHIPGDLGTTNETTIRNQVACFFQLVEGAGLGSYVVGRRGQPTRLEVAVDSLGQFVAESDLERQVATEIEIIASEGDGQIQADTVEKEDIEDLAAQARMISGPSSHAEKEPDQGAPRVFISHGKNMEIVDQIKTMLELADLDYEVVVEEESTAIPVPEKVFDAMHRCTSAVMCVTADEGMKLDDGSYRVNDNVLIEIGAAFVLYDKRVVLVWDRRIDVPSNLQGLYRCEFEGDELSWSAGMKLMKAVNKFKRSA